MGRQSQLFKQDEIREQCKEVIVRCDNETEQLFETLKAHSDFLKKSIPLSAEILLTYKDQEAFAEQLELNTRLAQETLDSLKKIAGNLKEKAEAKERLAKVNATAAQWDKEQHEHSGVDAPI